MAAYIGAVLFILGAIIASFVGCVAARLHTGADLLLGRSRCDACGAVLGPRSLIPIFSWFAYRGRCFSCSARISALAPLSELMLGALYILAYLKLGLTPALLFLALALAALLGIVLYDLAHTIVPAAFLLPFLVASALYALFAGPAALLATGAYALGMAAALALLHYASGGRAMGLADAPVALGLALIAGGQALAGFILSFWIGAAVGIIILAKAPRGHRMGIEVPFAPFMAAGFLLAYFSGWDPFSFIVALLAPILV